MRQAGTWNPLLQCLHLDEPLLQQQNTRNYKRLKITTCMPANSGRKIQKDQKNLKCHFRRAGSKRRGLCMPPAPRERWASHRSPTPGHTPTPPHTRNKLVPPQVGTRKGDSLPTAAAGDPIKPCLNFLSGLWSISIDWEGQEPWSVSSDSKPNCPQLSPPSSPQPSPKKKNEQ